MSVPTEIMEQELDIAMNAELGDGYAEKRKKESAAFKKLKKWYEKDNVLDELDQNKKNEIKQQVQNQYTEDYASMKPWLKKYTRALDLAKMNTKEGAKQKPFKGAAKVMMPKLMEGATSWNARVVMDILATGEVVQPRVIGKDKGDAKYDRAQRQSTYINYELTENMGYKRQTDRQLMAHPIVGTTYKKTYFSDTENKYRSDLVMADEVIFSQKVADYMDAPQVAHKYMSNRNDIVSNVNRGLWDCDHEKLDSGKVEFDTLECHFWYDLDGDGYAEPWIATILEDSQEMVRLVAGFEMEGVYEYEGKIYNINRDEYITQFIFLPDPDGSPMGLGWGILLADVFESINTNIRQLIDAGTIQNNAMNTGLVSSSLQPKMNQAQRVQEGFIELELGKYQSIQTASGQSLRDSVFQIPAHGPSMALFNLMQYLEDGSNKMMAAVWDLDVTAGEAASLYLARMKEAMKVPNSQVWRFYEGMKQEISILYKMIERNGDNEYYNRIIDEDVAYNIKDDFAEANCDVVPNCDPSLGSDVERMAKAEYITATAMGIGSGMMNNHAVTANNLKAAGIDDIDKLLPPPQEGPTPQQQQEAAYLQMEAEFKDREMQVRENRLQLDVAKNQIEALKIQAELEKALADLDKTDSETLLNTAKAIGEIAKVEASEIQTDIQLLEAANRQLVEDGNARTNQTANAGLDRPMEAGPRNPNLP